MKKIGIMTYHRANNVGAVLQNQALQLLLREYCLVETIDYKNKIIEKANRIVVARGVKQQIKFLFQAVSFIKRERVFNKYRKRYLNLSAKTYHKKNINDANQEYTCFITGSDQVWNTKLNGHDFAYFLDFVSRDNKRIAYAASFGNTNLDNSEIESILYELGKYNLITVREKDAQKMLGKYDITSDVVLDPTLLIPGKTWKDELDLKQEDEGNYVFVYMVAYTPELIDVAKKYAKQYDLDIYVMHYGYKAIKGVKNIRSASPRDFVQFVMNSKIVFCSSFHAICFSVLFEKSFVYALDKNRENNNSRIISLCKLLSLESRNLEKNWQEEEIDYTVVNKQLQMLRKISTEKLINVINEN